MTKMKILPLKRTSFSRPQLLIFIIAFSLIGYLIFKSFALNPNLPGDLNSDNTVNVTDMSILLSNYGTSNAAADINSDGTVNVLDMSILLSHYGQSLSTGFTNTVKPTISGTASVGSTLTASPGSWTPTPSGYGYAWDLCDSAGNNCGLSPTAVNQSTYVIQSGDAGHTIRVNVGPKDSGGATQWAVSVLSNATGVIGGSGGTTPPPAGTVYFDGRATHMTSLSSTGLSSTNNIVTSQVPKLWDCLCFTNNDIQLASDSRYSKVYSIKAEQGSQNPYNTGAVTTEAAAAEVSHIQPMTMGRWDWYANAYKIKSGWTQTPWMVLFQFGYPTLSSPPMALESDDLGTGMPSFQIFTNSGLLTKNSSGFYAGSLRTNWTIMNIPFDTWVEIIVGIKWETDNTGEVQVYTRIPSQTTAWSHPLSKTGIPTEQYGCTSYGCVSADFHEAPTVTDHGGEYYGYYGAHSIPTNYSWQSGLVDTSDLPTAQSIFP